MKDVVKSLLKVQPEYIYLPIFICVLDLFKEHCKFVRQNFPLFNCFQSANFLPSVHVLVSTPLLTCDVHVHNTSDILLKIVITFVTQLSWNVKTAFQFTDFMPLLLLLTIPLIYWVFLSSYFIHIPSRLWSADYLYFKYHIFCSPSELNWRKLMNKNLNSEKVWCFMSVLGSSELTMNEQQWQGFKLRQFLYPSWKWVAPLPCRNGLQNKLCFLLSNQALPCTRNSSFTSWEWSGANADPWTVVLQPRLAFSAF